MCNIGHAPLRRSPKGDPAVKAHKQGTPEGWSCPEGGERPPQSTSGLNSAPSSPEYIVWRGQKESEGSMVAGSCKYQKRDLREGNRSSPRVSFPVTVEVGTKLVCTSESPGCSGFS